MKNIGKHIGDEEVTRSRTAAQLGIDNTPNAVHLAAMRLVAATCFEPVHRHVGEAILIGSFFRTPALNCTISCAASSQHVRGEAIDMQAPSGAAYNNADIFHYIRGNCDFDQLIWEIR